MANKMTSDAHKGTSAVLWSILVALIVFIGWANFFTLDQVTRASGEVIASSRVQIIQAVDGGVLQRLNVREGDRVQEGQLLAELDKTRFEAGVNELEYKLANLRARAARLQAEAVDSETITFSEPMEQAYPDLVRLQRDLFKQSRKSLKEELRTLDAAIALAREEAALVNKLAQTGDVSRSELIRVRRALNDTEAKRINRHNEYVQNAQEELTRTQDETLQTEQVLAQRQQQLNDTQFLASTPGIVKNVKITTIGGVLHSGEELMQIIPTEDELIIEAQIRPDEIARVRAGLPASIRFDPYDYTIFGAVEGVVSYVSADTLEEESSRGKQKFYRAHIKVPSPVVSLTGQKLDIVPGMTAQVDIRTGQRKVINYLLKPIHRVAAEAFGEG